MKRTLSIGLYNAGDLQRAFRVALARAHLRHLRSPSRQPSPVNHSSYPIGCDVRPDGKVVPL